MLQIGQSVYSVDQIEVKHTAQFCIHTYVAEKVVNGIHQARDSEITYMAGEPHKLVFHETSSGQYLTLDGHTPVYLTYEAAENERQARIRKDAHRALCSTDQVPLCGGTISDDRYAEQKQFIDKVAASIGCAAIQADHQSGSGRPNMVLLYFLDDAKHNLSVEQEAIRYTSKEAADFERNTGSPVDSKYVYRDYFWSFQNTDQFGFCSADFANEGCLDLRGPNWQTILEGSIKLAFFEKVQALYVTGSGGYGALREADGDYNDLNRNIIDAFYKANGAAFLGKINLSREKREQVSTGADHVLEEYTGQPIHNFECDYVVPCVDRILEQMILDWNKVDPSHDQPPFDKIWDAVDRLNGRHFLWY